MDITIQKSSFYNRDLTNKTIIHTPTPIKSKCSGLYTMMGFENTIESRFESDFDIINGLSHSFTPGFEHIRKQSVKSEVSPENYIRSEPGSPEKVSTYGSSSRDFSESDDTNSDCFHQEIPSRASNPHIFDDFFNTNDHMKNNHKKKSCMNLIN